MAYPKLQNKAIITLLSSIVVVLLKFKNVSLLMNDPLEQLHESYS